MPPNPLNLPLPLNVTIDVNDLLKNYADRPIGHIVKWLKKKVRIRKQKKLDEHRFELISRLFGIEGLVGIQPAASHPEIGAVTTPDTEEALLYLTKLIDSDKLEAHVEYPVIRPSDNLLCLGGPVANSLTRQNMGYYQVARMEFAKIPNFPVDFPIWFDLAQQASHQAATRYRGGKICTERSWPVVVQGDRYAPDATTGGWLRTDYLLIVRMPNLLNETAWEEKKDFIIVSGAHGTGTRAIQTLFEDFETLSSVAKQVGESHYFVCLLRVPEIIHDDKKCDTVPLKVENMTSMALVIDKERVGWWFRKKYDKRI